MTNPERKNAGIIVRRSTIPSNESKNLIRARPFEASGYKKPAVQMRSTYSIQKINTVIYSITENIPDKNARPENVSIKVTLKNFAERKEHDRINM